jgi:hypothetical protein
VGVGGGFFLSSFRWAARGRGVTKANATADQNRLGFFISELLKKGKAQ